MGSRYSLLVLVDQVGPMSPVVPDTVLDAAAAAVDIDRVPALGCWDVSPSAARAHMGPRGRLARRSPNGTMTVAAGILRAGHRVPRMARVATA